MTIDELTESYRRTLELWVAMGMQKEPDLASTNAALGAELEHLEKERAFIAELSGPRLIPILGVAH